MLFRDEEADIRRKLVEADIIECVLGLGPNLFYNSPMEACVVVCQMSKSPERKNKVLFINAVNEVTRERAQSFLEDDHIDRIVKVYHDFADEDGFARVATLADVLANQANLSIPLYVRPTNGNGNGADQPEKPLPEVIAEWEANSQTLRTSMDELFAVLNKAELKEAA